MLGEIAGAGLSLTRLRIGSGGKAQPSGERLAYSPARGEPVMFAVYDRASLEPGMTMAGPAVIEEMTSTTIVDVDGAVEVDAYGSLMITLGGM